MAGVVIVAGTSNKITYSGNANTLTVTCNAYTTDAGACKNFLEFGNKSIPTSQSVSCSLSWTKGSTVAFASFGAQCWGSGDYAFASDRWDGNDVGPTKPSSGFRSCTKTASFYPFSLKAGGHDFNFKMNYRFYIGAELKNEQNPTVTGKMAVLNWGWILEADIGVGNHYVAGSPLSGLPCAPVGRSITFELKQYGAGSQTIWMGIYVGGTQVASSNFSPDSTNNFFGNTIRGTHSRSSAGTYPIKGQWNMTNCPSIWFDKSKPNGLDMSWYAISGSRPYWGAYEFCWYVPAPSNAWPIPSPQNSMPSNYNPSISISNTTPEDFSIYQSKVISCSVYIGDNGVNNQYWASGTVTFNAYYNDGTHIGSWQQGISNPNAEGYSVGFSTSINIRSRDRDEHVYWTATVRFSAGNGNNVRSSSTTSGTRNIFWAYVEMTLIQFTSRKVIQGPVSGRWNDGQAQLFYGGTQLSFTLGCSVQPWGDRPGTRTYEFYLCRPVNTDLLGYGRNVTSDTGGKSHSYSYSIPDSWVNQNINFRVRKRLNDTEYTYSGNPKVPTRGANNAVSSNVWLYEVIGAVSNPNLIIKPNILMVTISSTISGTSDYDKQSSQKCRYWIEVYDRDLGVVEKQFDLRTVTGSIQEVMNYELTSASFQVANPHLYELRLYATITEILGNTHTYWFGTQLQQSFLPPRYALSQQSNLLLPTGSPTSLTIRQGLYTGYQATPPHEWMESKITYTYRITYDLQLRSSTLYIEYYLASDPHTKISKYVNILPPTYTGGGFNGTYTFEAEGPLAVGTKVVAWVGCTWNLPGVTNIYQNKSFEVYYSVTPTRYLYYFTRHASIEYLENKIHSVSPTKADKVSRKIYIEFPE